MPGPFVILSTPIVILSEAKNLFLSVESLDDIAKRFRKPDLNSLVGRINLVQEALQAQVEY